MLIGASGSETLTEPRGDHLRRLL